MRTPILPLARLLPWAAALGLLTGCQTMAEQAARPTDPGVLQGMFRYLADAARFEDCATGRSYPVAMEGDFRALQRAYLEAPKSAPGAPLMALFEGTIAPRPPMEGPGPVPTVVVSRAIGVFPGQSCERSMSRASLANQYWRVVTLGGQRLGAVQGRREAHVILRADPGGYVADAGCGRFGAAYRVDGDRIAFDLPAGALPACPPELEALQTALAEVLRDARRWSIQAQVLELFGADRKPLAVLETVYFR